MDVPELPVELIDGVFEHLSVFGLYDCRTVCRSWLSHASRARNAKGVLMVVGSCGGKLGRAKSIHPCVRGKVMFPVTGLCGFGDGFLLAADTKRHRLLVVQTTPATAELVVHSRFGGGYYGSDPSPHPLNFCSPQSVLHCRTDGRDVFYVADSDNGRVRRLFAAEFGMDSQPTARSAWTEAAVDSPSWSANGGVPMISGNFQLNMSFMPAPDFDPRPPTFFGYFDDARSPVQYEHPTGLALHVDANELYFCDYTLNIASRVNVVDATSLQHKRTFAIEGDGSGILARCHPNGVLVHNGEVYVVTLSFIDVYTTNGEFLRHFLPSGGLKLRPGGAEHPLPRSAAVYPIGGVDHMLVVSAKHVHVLSLPDAATRQLITVPGADYLHTICVHQGRVHVSDRNGGRIHTLNPIGNNVP